MTSLHSSTSKAKAQHYPRTNLVGQRFTRLLVEAFAGRRRFSKPYWLCLCDCGTTTVIAGSSLVRGFTRSCGCLATERKENDARGFQPIHGMTDTPTFKRWSSMLARCYKSSDISYPNYGGRGISVCDRWRTSFQAFYDDMGPAPNGRQLDRIDNDGNYEPGNCRWATLEQQGNNRRTNRLLTYEGQRMTLAQWNKAQGFPKNVLHKRLAAGWTLARALETPLRRDSRHTRKDAHEST